jgi:prepilin-type N-terminal cleavage/methylation domain-containing protein/prepilin-type processing-associated H-X9-DG protein
MRASTSVSRANSRGGAPAGFSLVELLVVIGVIGLLLAIGVPAVQRVREAARRTQCTDHLKQIGVALQNHQSQQGRLPQDGYHGYGYAVFLLPFVEQSPLFNAIGPLTAPLADATASVADQTDVLLPVFRCPSDANAPRLEPSQFGRSNYLGSSDLFTEATDLAKVHDGESNTLAVGETTTDQAWALPGTGTADSPPNHGGRFSSRHSGGAQFVLCDGAVKFISDSIDASLFRALGTPRGGEPIGEF